MGYVFAGSTCSRTLAFLTTLHFWRSLQAACLATPGSSQIESAAAANHGLHYFDHVCGCHHPACFLTPFEDTWGFFGVAAHAMVGLDPGATAGRGAARPARAALATARAAAQRAADDVVGVDARDAAGARLAAGVCSEEKRRRTEKMCRHVCT